MPQHCVCDLNGLDTRQSLPLTQWWAVAPILDITRLNVALPQPLELNYPSPVESMSSSSKPETTSGVWG
jgi:hypothetical protein